MLYDGLTAGGGLAQVSEVNRMRWVLGWRGSGGRSPLSTCPAIPDRPCRSIEAGALGAAILAGAGGGVYASAEEAIAALVKIDRVFEPDPRQHALYDERFARYHRLYPFMRGLTDSPAS